MATEVNNRSNRSIAILVVGALDQMDAAARGERKVCGGLADITGADLELLAVFCN